MDNRNGAYGSVIGKNFSVGIYNSAPCGLDAAFPLMQFFCLFHIIFRPEDHQIHKPPDQHHKKEQTEEQYRNCFAPVEGFMGMFRFSHFLRKPHKKVLI